MKAYYHNITKEIINESDHCDFIEAYEDGDECYKSEWGDATLIRMTNEELIEMQQEYKGEL